MKRVGFRGLVVGMVVVALAGSACRRADDDGGDPAMESGNAGAGSMPVAGATGGGAVDGELPSKLARTPGKQADGRQPPAPKYREAVPIPGKTGYVFNPFTNNPVDVRGIPPGTLVRDPADPDKDHRFRVPPSAAEPPVDRGSNGGSGNPIPEIP